MAPDRLDLWQLALVVCFLPSTRTLPALVVVTLMQQLAPVVLFLVALAYTLSVVVVVVVVIILDKLRV